MSKLLKFSNNVIGPYVVLFKYNSENESTSLNSSGWEFGDGFNSWLKIKHIVVDSEHDPLCKQYSIGKHQRASVHERITKYLIPADLVKAVSEIIICSLEHKHLTVVEHLHNEDQIAEYMKNVVDS